MIGEERRFVTLPGDVEILPDDEEDEAQEPADDVVAAGPPEEETVPYHVSQDVEDCAGYAVVKDADGEVMGCHDTQEEADAQVAALYAEEGPDGVAASEEWHSLLVPEGVRSGDGREFAPNSIDWRELPLPLMREVVSTHGGMTSETVRTGDITRIERIDSEVHGWGNWHDTPEGEAHRQFVAGGRRGVSIDGDNTTENDIEYIYPDGLDPDSDEAMMAMPEVILYHYARIMGVTDVPFPAFQEAYIELVNGDEEMVPTGAPVTGSGEGDAPEEFVNSGAMIALSPDPATIQRLSLGPDLGLEDDDLHLTLRYLGNVGEADPAMREQAIAAATELASGIDPIETEAFAAALFDPTGDEPAVVMLIDSDDVRALEASIDPNLAAAESHTFNPHLTLEYPDSASFGDAFQRAIERVGPIRFDRVRVAWGDENQYFPLGGEPADEPVEDDELLASAFPTTPDASWFEDPQLNGPTPWTVDDDGRVYGHLALHGTCHIGVAGTCMTPPREADYSYFRTGSIRCSSGEDVAVGQITLGTSHAPKTAHQFAAAEHYDHTGTAAADVACGTDRWGIWVAGAARPHLTDEQVRELRAGAISGDWRKFGTGLRLVAALMVNVPGFPIPRASTFTHRGEQTALVASGIVTEPAPLARSQQYYKDRALRIAVAAGLDNASKAARLAASIGKE